MKAIIFDVDDTVCKSTQPATPEMLYELARLRNDLNLELVFISGSTVEQICGQLEGLRATCHVFGGSGTQYSIRHSDDSDGSIEPMYYEEIEYADRAMIKDALYDLVYTHNIVPMTNHADQIQDRGSQITLSALGRNAPAINKRDFDPDCSKRILWAEYLNKRFPFMTNFSIKYGGTTSLDITYKNRDKMYGLLRFEAHSGINLEECIFFGDKLDPGGNDNCVVGNILAVKVESPEDTLSIIKRLV